MIPTSSRAKRLRAAPTLAEVRVWRWLRILNRDGAHWRRQAQIGPYVFDFAWLSARALIEVDGGVHVRRRGRDETKEAWALGRNFRILRVTNADVFTRPDWTFAAIQSFAPPR